MSGISLNEDDSHYYFTDRAFHNTKQNLDAFIDQYADTQVNELLLCPNCMVTSYKSAVWDPIWRDIDQIEALEQSGDAGYAAFLKWMRAAKLLSDQGIDPYARWIARARDKGISPWISMRMNDVHNVDDEEAPLHSRFWLNHPEYRRVTYLKNGLSWVDRAFDYGHEEVRNYHFALIREMADRWDFDGLELDFMRFGYLFAPGMEETGAKLLNGFMKDVRELLDRKERSAGHRIELAVRVPAQPDTARRLGYDVLHWVDHGLVSRVTPTAFWTSTDTDMPIELWRRLLGGSVMLCGGVEVLIRPNEKAAPERSLQTIETARGCAASLLARGCDRVYLFNFMDQDTCIRDMENYPALLREIGSLETMNGKPRRHILTFADTFAPGCESAPRLPETLSAGQRAYYRLHTGPKPESGNGNFLRLGVEGDAADLTAYVNGMQCVKMPPDALPDFPPDGEQVVYKIPEGALNAGDNVAILAAGAGIRVRSVEIDIDFHKGG